MVQGRSSAQSPHNHAIRYILTVMFSAQAIARARASYRARARARARDRARDRARARNGDRARDRARAIGLVVVERPTIYNGQVLVKC